MHNNVLLSIIFRENWLILQLANKFSFTIDARFVKHAFMIHLRILIMAI